ncbi:hypothetical protein FRC08_010284 [Ceratobasidium sp. 394]|nr:hypothetical protein FRC08_010284 [Ceratobasidium sp. 394]
MDTSASLHNGVLQRWKSARITLSHAINDYLAASVGLCHLLSASSAHHPSLCHSLEQILSGIDLELLSLQSEEERLKQTRITLANERNKSRVLDPACRLPLEILATIFAMATSQYTKRDRTASSRSHASPIVLSSVSSSWRQIALTTPSLWSYIDLVIGSTSTPSHRKQAELWVQRSCNAALYINIYEKSSYSNQEPVPKHQIASLLEFLAPLMHRVCALNLGARVAMHDILPSVLALWAKHTSTDIKRALEVADHFGSSDAVLGPAADGSFSADELNSFLRSFNRITVMYCRISESVMFHEGLVELHLEGLEASHTPTQQELVAMLATCPRLRILVLADCCVEPSEAIPSPVALNHLEFLSLESAGASRNFVHVFPLLFIGSEGLSMSLTLDRYCDFFDEARVFFSRTKVTRLHVSAVQRYTPLSMLSYPIPHLETLALEYFDMLNNDIHNMTLWPRLRTLYLKDSVIDVGRLQQLVQLHHSLKTLHVYRPKTNGQPKISMTDDECADLAESMQMVEELQVEESDWGSCTIGTWDFVMFDD